MSKTFDFIFDLTCPFAYLASTRVEALAERNAATLVPRPVLLGGVYEESGREESPVHAMTPAKMRHALNDLRRAAQVLDQPLKLPEGQPRSSLTALRCLLAAGEPFMPLAHHFYRALWVEGADISTDEGAGKVLAEAGLDAGAVLERARSEETKEELQRRTDEAAADGAFGVPTFLVDGRLFWGQDRMYQVERALGGEPEDVALPEPGPEDAPVDFFFDYSSPFTALAASRVESVLGASARFRPMLLGAVFKTIGAPMVPLQNIPAAKQEWIARDLRRQSAEAGYPLRWPSRFPMLTILPLRLTLAAGPDTAEGRRMAHAFFRAYWCEDRDIADLEVVTEILDEQGFDSGALIEQATAPAIKQALKDETQAAVEAGVFGAPSFVVRRPGAEPALYWGNDRLELAARASRGVERAI